MEDEKPSQTQEMSKMTEGPSYKDSLIGEAFLNPQDLEDYQREEYISEDGEEEDDGEVDCQKDGIYLSTEKAPNTMENLGNDFFLTKFSN
ncbi:hypothetical protein POTOM_047240 [Populus tomentosa]|uniref:Uncharacterized protein n=1 Tax=Populus tomentosa TaxID=118781 RepID=A0A8X7YBN9_POPTO|nr:hypothetical protein POTOM_047240 [Populus tomentosa]